MTVQGMFRVEWANVETRMDGSADVVTPLVNALAIDYGKRRIRLSVLDDNDGRVIGFFQKMIADPNWKFRTTVGGYRIRFDQTAFEGHTVDLGVCAPQINIPGMEYRRDPVEHKITLTFKSWATD